MCECLFRIKLTIKRYIQVACASYIDKIASWGIKIET
jgi:hypothetical protein